jgi:hypothetical protein
MLNVPAKKLRLTVRIRSRSIATKRKPISPSGPKRLDLTPGR